MRIALPALLLLAACASGATQHPAPSAAEPGGVVVVQAQEFPVEITGLLTEAEADSCGVCIREKRADAFEIAGEWFAPGHLVEAGTTRGWWLLEGGDQELYFGEPGETSPRLTFRFHTADAHLVGIAPEDFTDRGLAARILARPAGEPGTETLEVVEFRYGNGESFHFDEERNRIQVQCRVLDAKASADSLGIGGPMRASGRR